jgi:hypothetical protein
MEKELENFKLARFALRPYDQAIIYSPARQAAV